MTTATWSSRVRHDSNATYVEWRDEFITKLGVLAAGGYITADETNITPGSGTLPGTSTEGNYAVYHLSDSLHGTAPVYIRFGFGTGGSTNAPRIQITVGTATNGSGTLTTTIGSAIASVNGSNTQTGDTARVSYMCAVPGCFWFNWKQGSGSTEAFFIFMRTVDSAGAITATGGLLVRGNGSASLLTNTRALRYAATAAAYTTQTNLPDTALGMIAQNASSTLVGTDIQVAVAWTITPQMAPLVGCVGVKDAEVAAGTTFPATPVGSTSRTYIGLTTVCGPFGYGTASAVLKFAALYE